MADGGQEANHANRASDYSSDHDAEKAPSEKNIADETVIGAGEPPEETSDSNIVDWDGPDDPENPMNWPGRQKLYNITNLVFLTLITPLASSMFAPGVPQVLRDFHNDSQTLAEFVVSVYILGFAIGPLLISPCSEMYGRYPVYAVCNVLFIVFTVACAVAQNLTQLIVFRFFAGAFGVCPVTLGGATISDVIPQEKRGAAMSLYGIGPLLGPVIGPVAGGFLSQAEGWRWDFWVLAIAYGFFTIFHLILCRETYAPVLLARKVRRLKKAGGSPNLKSKLDDDLSPRERIIRALVRPCKMLFRSPIVGLMSLYVAVVYGILYLLFTTFTFVFEGLYGFSSSIVGLSFVAVGIGLLIGLLFIGTTSDRFLKGLTARNGGGMKPEYRLPPLMITAWTIPVGLFIYGWTVQYEVQWAVPLFGTLLFGIGTIAVLICIQTYLIDAFTRYAASSVAANTLLRSIVGAVLPLGGLEMYQALGFGWGNTLLGFIAVAMTPIPFVFYRYGEKIRTKFQVQL